MHSLTSGRFHRCGHCKKLAPEYEQVGTAFKRMKSLVVVGKVRSSAEL